MVSEKETAQAVVNIDMGNLMAFDPRPLDTNDMRNAEKRGDYLKSMATTVTQFLIERTFQLPTEKVEDVFVVKLPPPETILPREKPLPKAKPLTKWEQYAKMKGIKKKKKSRMVFDEASGEWKPSWGYKRANDSTKDWCVEIKSNEDPNQDFFAKKTAEKNERVAKNELQRLRNIARTTKGKVPGVGITPTVVDPNKPDKLKIKKQLHVAKKSDASMSKFSQKLDGEEKLTKGLNKKRKFEPNFKDVNSEKSSQLKILDSITSNKGKLSKEKINSEKAVNKFINEESKFSREKSHYNRRSSAGGHKKMRSKNKK